MSKITRLVFYMYVPINRFIILPQSRNATGNECHIYLLKVRLYIYIYIIHYTLYVHVHKISVYKGTCYLFFLKY